MKISGTISSLEDFNRIIEEVRCRRAFTQGYGLPYRQEFYRGQLDSSWKIKPGLTRTLKTPTQVADAEEQIIQLFKNEISARHYQHRVFLHEAPRAFQNEWAWVIQAQHYGIPTRLLDWTLKPEVALYFAVDNSALDHEDGQFLILFVPFNEVKTESGRFNQYYDINPNNVSQTWFLNPSFYQHTNYENTTAEIRRARQHGKFTMQLYENSLLGLEEQSVFHTPWKDNMEAFALEKYIIPSKAKPQLRLELISQGWHGEYLYVKDDETINIICEKCKELLAKL